MPNDQIWVSVSVDGQWSYGEATADKIYVWVQGLRRLEVRRNGDSPNTFASGRVYDDGEKPPDFQRLLFCKNNVLAEFLVRIYRSRVEAENGYSDFARRVNPSREI